MTKPTHHPETERQNPQGDRLQKILAQAGIASRRKAEEIILEGRVQVNGIVVNTLGTRHDATRDHIRVDGKLLHGPEQQRYYMLNKPRGYVTTLDDPEKRPTVMQLMAKQKSGPHGDNVRLYPVGRLDYLSEGLLLMTNDGALANALSKAAAGVEKTYLVKISGVPPASGLEQIRRGIMIDRGRLDEVRSGRRDRIITSPAKIELVRGGDNPWYELTLDRRPQSPDPQDVRRDRPPRRKDPPHRLWSSPSRRPAGRVPRTDAGRSHGPRPRGEGQESRPEKEDARVRSA